jgi:hypothetical protein
VTRPVEGSRLVRLVINLTAGLCFAVLVAITLPVLDLYLAGHGRWTSRGRLLEWPALGLHLSLADLLFLLALVVGAVLTWRRLPGPGA